MKLIPTSGNVPARLTGDQKVFFDEQDYLVVKNALPPETVSELN